jgi:hypothetical protein
MAGFSKMWEYILSAADFPSGRHLSLWPTEGGGYAVVMEDLPKLMRTHPLYDDQFAIRIKNLRADLFGKHNSQLATPVLSAVLARFIRNAADLAQAYPRNGTIIRCTSLPSPVHPHTAPTCSLAHTYQHRTAAYA